VHVAVVCLEYDGKNVVQPDAGFGFLVPSFDKDTKLLGITFDSCSFPIHDAGKDITRITCMLGGEWFEENFGDVDENVKDNTKVIQAAIEGAKICLGFRRNPIRVIAAVHKDCIPQYQLNHKNLVSNIRADINSANLPLELIGSSYDGVAVNECVFYARKAVEELLTSKNLRTGLLKRQLSS
jgi:oxygen-dependent protoporphyrinogen oxidase